MAERAELGLGRGVGHRASNIAAAAKAGSSTGLSRRCRMATVASAVRSAPESRARVGLLPSSAERERLSRLSGKKAPSTGPEMESQSYYQR